MDYRFDLPTKILAGPGCSAQLGVHVGATGAKRVLCVYDKGVEAAGIVDPIVANLEAAGIEVARFSGVQPDPPLEVVEECTATAAGMKPDAFVAVGGGSSIDTAKAVNANLMNPGKLKDHAIQLNGLKVFPFENRLKPLFALPTTAGTGSEVSQGAVVTDSELKLKLSVITPDMTPTMAVVDPSLMTGMPPNVTASTGLDAFAHAVEGMMSGLAILTPSPMRDSFALTAIELVINNLPTAIKDGKDIAARTNMAYAAFMAMLGSTSGYSMGHVMGHAIGEVSSIHNHGFICASVLPFNVEFLAEKIPTQLIKLARLLNVDTDGRTVEAIGSAVNSAMRDFYRACGLPSLKELGMATGDIKEIVSHSTKGTWYMLAPKKPTEEEMSGWLQAAYEGWD
ncbi:MAG: iron-containing alcohol dehydrogenase [Spirochaetes bacterium]|nr:iron-containing alcohol dehydrogenase [Spirochaetota bacterium]